MTADFHNYKSCSQIVKACFAEDELFLIADKLEDVQTSSIESRVLMIESRV